MIVINYIHCSNPTSKIHDSHSRHVNGEQDVYWHASYHEKRAIWLMNNNAPGVLYPPTNGDNDDVTENDENEPHAVV